jgi:DNA-binding protein HU-beta
MGHWYKDRAAIQATEKCPGDCGVSELRTRGEPHHACEQSLNKACSDSILFRCESLFREGVRYMNRGEFVAAISDQSGLTKADADRALEAMFKVVKKTLKSGDTVSLVGFGTFVVRKRAARTGRNPRTGDTIKIKASKVPAFKAGKALKDAVG